MAKKDFKKFIEEDNNNVEEITKSFFSEETLNKASNKQEEQKERKAYAKFESKKNKTHFIGIRLTDEQHEDLLKQVEKTKSGTITNYLMRLIEKGL